MGEVIEPNLNKVGWSGADSFIEAMRKVFQDLDSSGERWQIQSKGMRPYVDSFGHQHLIDLEAVCSLYPEAETLIIELGERATRALLAETYKGESTRHVMEVIKEHPWIGEL